METLKDWRVWLSVALAVGLVWLWFGIENKRFRFLIEQMKEKFQNVIDNPRLREDSMGSGKYGAPRGSRKHKGVDVIAVPGESVYSPIEGKVVREGTTYADSSVYKLLEIKGIGEFAGFTAKMLYVEPLPGIVGETVCAGQEVGIAQDIANYHDPNRMKHHVHVELYANGVLIDPTNYVFNQNQYA